MTDSKKPTQMDIEELLADLDPRYNSFAFNNSYECRNIGKTLYDLKEESDSISPFHYKLPSGLEVQDIMKDVMGIENVKQFYKGNIIKYVLRADKKNGIEDYKKAKRYIEMLEELEECV